MGRSTDTDIVPFIIHGAFEMSSNGLSESPHDWELLISPEVALDELGVETIGPFRGWAWAEHDDRRVGKRGRLHGDLWQKGGHEVWLINESEYSNVGEYEMAIVANDRAALEEFVADWHDVMDYMDIEGTDTCKQTG